METEKEKEECGVGCEEGPLHRSERQEKINIHSEVNLQIGVAGKAEESTQTLPPNPPEGKQEEP